jgi:hypothetical protein
MCIFHIIAAVRSSETASAKSGFDSSPLMRFDLAPGSCDFLFGSTTAAGVVVNIVKIIQMCMCRNNGLPELDRKTDLLLVHPALLPFTPKHGADLGACPNQSPFTGFRAL